jgi:hypothetical protein
MSRLLGRLVRLAYARRDLRPHLLPLVIGKQAKILVPPRRGQKGKVIFVQFLLKKLKPLAAQLNNAKPEGLEKWREMFEAAGVPLEHLWPAITNLNIFIRSLEGSLSELEAASPGESDFWGAWGSITSRLRKSLFGSWGSEDDTSRAIEALDKLLHEGAPPRGTKDPRAEERLGTLEYIRDNLTIDSESLDKEGLYSVGNVLTNLGDPDYAGYFYDLQKHYDSPAAFAELAELWDEELRYAINRAREGMAEAEGPEWDPSQIPAEDMAALENFNRIAQEAQALVSEAHQRVQTQKSETVPASESQEQVFHASIKARQLFQQGFAQEVPDQEGLGGSQTAGGHIKGTSFTYDLRVAKEISRTLKEMTMIAQGKISAREILDWIKRSRLAERVVEDFNHLDGSSIRPYKLGFEDGAWILQDRRGKRVAPDQAFDTPLKRAVLFKHFLRISGQADKRYDPLVMHLHRVVPILAKANLQDIGVVVATVDMTHPHITHIPGERELRIPPEAIISVDKFF